MRTTSRYAAVLFGLLLWTSTGQAQTCTPQTTPQFTAGGSVFARIASQWNSYFAAKVDANNGTLCNPHIIGGTGLGLTGLSGDVVAGPGQGVVPSTISAQAVTYAKIQNVTGNRLLGNPAGSTGSVTEIPLGANLSFVAGALVSAGGGCGTGTANTVVKWTGTSTCGNSSITDDGTTVTIAAGLVVGTATGGNQGTSTVNASEYYIDGNLFAPGTSGHTVPFLDGTNTFSAAQTFGTILPTIVDLPTAGIGGGQIKGPGAAYGAASGLAATLTFAQGLGGGSNNMNLDGGQTLDDAGGAIQITGGAPVSGSGKAGGNTLLVAARGDGGGDTGFIGLLGDSGVGITPIPGAIVLQPASGSSVYMIGIPVASSCSGQPVNSLISTTGTGVLVQC